MIVESIADLKIVTLELSIDGDFFMLDDAVLRDRAMELVDFSELLKMNMVYCRINESNWYYSLKNRYFDHGVIYHKSRVEHHIRYMMEYQTQNVDVDISLCALANDGN